jgi:aryl-alcohol dehydrogenase-like predicted oxidoreductase
VTKFGVGYEEAFRRRDRQQPTAVMASIEKSLRHLQTDYVDVYLVYWPDVNTPFEETMRALDDIVRQGKARYIGVSNFRLAQLEACM